MRQLISMLRGQLRSRGRGNIPVSVVHKVLLALRYFATGSFLRCGGNLINVHESTICRIVHKVARTLATLHLTYIVMPNEEEQRDISAAFYMKAGMRVIGIMDCTHIPIVFHGTVRNVAFTNRRGYVTPLFLFL